MIKYVLALVPVFYISGCTYESRDDDFDCNTYDLELNLIETIASNCNVADGAIEVEGSGGSGNYQYSIENGALQNSGVFTGLIAGTYNVMVQDELCAKSMEVEVPSEGGISMDITGITDSGCGSSNGSITVQVSGGVEPYGFRLNNGTIGESPQFNNLERGDYTVLAVDQEGCEITDEATVLSGISYSTSVNPIIQNNCATSGCHNGQNSLPDYTDFSNVQNDAGQIKARTQNGSMPPNSTLSAEQIEAIACWVDDGSLNN